MGFFHDSVDCIGISGRIFGIQWSLVGVYDPGNSISYISLVGEYNSRACIYFKRIIRKKKSAGFQLEDHESFLDGFNISYPNTITSTTIVVFYRDETDGRKNGENGDGHDELDECEAEVFMTFRFGILCLHGEIVK